VVGGWRWVGLNIPSGARIINAWVEVSQSGYGDNITTTLTFENVANPATFSRASSPAHRLANRTAFAVPWTWGGPKKPSDWFSTPSLAAGIQELVDRYGTIWQVVLLESGVGVPPGQYHAWNTYDWSPSLAARLHIVFSF
jgi:hypothetical protein